MKKKDLAKNELEICTDMLVKLRQTNQIYIVQHDYPISISKYLFWMLDKKRRELAKIIGVPEEQYEFEDLFLHFLGLTPLNVMRQIVKELKRKK